jgi:hypothetical protein
MLAFELFIWWYGQGWAATVKNIRKMLLGISNLFSVPILARTLFAPWKRIISYPGAGLDAKLRALSDNVVSRAIGFAVRVLVLLTALIIGTLAVVFGVLAFVLWPLVPPGVILLLIKGVIG